MCSTRTREDIDIDIRTWRDRESLGENGIEAYYVDNNTDVI